MAASSVAAPAASPAHTGATGSGQDPGAEQDREVTTLIHNEEESFALAPVRPKTNQRT